MLGSILGGVASSVAGGLLNKFLGGSSSADSASSPNLFSSDQNTVGIDSALNGANRPDQANPSFTESALKGLKSLGADAFKGFSEAAPGAVKQGVESLLNPKRSPKQKGSDARDYLAAAFPELNPWERAGAGGTMSGLGDANLDNQKDIAKMQMANNIDVAKINAKNQLDIAGIQSATSRANTADTVYAPNQMLPFNQRESTERVRNLISNSALSVEQATTQVTQQLLNKAQEANVRLTAPQIEAMTDKVGEDIKRQREETNNARYGSSQAGKTVKDVSNVLYDGGSYIWSKMREFDSWIDSKISSDNKKEEGIKSTRQY